MYNCSRDFDFHGDISGFLSRTVIVSVSGEKPARADDKSQRGNSVWVPLSMACRVWPDICQNLKLTLWRGRDSVWQGSMKLDSVAIEKYNQLRYNGCPKMEIVFKIIDIVCIYCVIFLTHKDFGYTATWMPVPNFLISMDGRAMTDLASR